MAAKTETETVIELGADQLNALIERGVAGKVTELEASFEERMQQSREAIVADIKAWHKLSDQQRAEREAELVRAALMSRPGAEAKTVKMRSAVALFITLALRGKRDRGDHRALAEEATKMGHPEVAKALTSSTAEDGGILIPEEYSADFIGGVYAQTVMRQLGARVIRTPAGKVSIGRLNGSATHYWVEEGSAGTFSDQKFGLVKLDVRKGMVLVRVSNDLVRRAPEAQQIIVEDAQSVAAVAMDAAFIRANGSQSAPRGIYYQVASGQRFNSAGTTLAQIEGDLLKAIYKVQSQMPSETAGRGGWIMNLRDKFGLLTVRTTDGYPIYAAQLAMDMLFGYPVRTTNSIPTNLDPGASGTPDKSEVYFADFSEIIIGDTLQPRIDVDQSKFFDSDEMALRVIHESDIVLRRDKAASVIERVTWGAAIGS